MAGGVEWRGAKVKGGYIITKKEEEEEIERC